MQHQADRRPVHDISRLRRGDRVELRRAEAPGCHGLVKDTAPGLGMLWIREDGGRRRRAVAAEDFSIYLVD